MNHHEIHKYLCELEHVHNVEHLCECNHGGQTLEVNWDEIEITNSARQIPTEGSTSFASTASVLDLQVLYLYYMNSICTAFKSIASVLHLQVLHLYFIYKYCICTAFESTASVLHLKVMHLYFNFTNGFYTYEVSSIKNANLFIKYEGIKLQKCLIACKKGINVVDRLRYSEIGWLENSTFHSQLSWTK